MIIKEIFDRQEKKEISSSILEALPHWFGIQASRQEYINESSHFPFFAAMDESNPLGFISIKENNPYTAEIYVMGVLPDCHNQGIGRALVSSVLQWAKATGYEF